MARAEEFLALIRLRWALRGMRALFLSPSIVVAGGVGGRPAGCERNNRESMPFAIGPCAFGFNQTASRLCHNRNPYRIVVFSGSRLCFLPSSSSVVTCTTWPIGCSG